MLSREEGKPLAEGKGEVYRAGQFFTYFAAEALRLHGDQAESVRPGIEIDVRREPVGVVAIISPWNFPVATPAWKIAPALAFGNAVVWKPANLTPACAVALTEIIARQDIPPGLFNLVLGPGREVGQRLVESPLVDAISFTGSVAVGRGIAASGHRQHDQAADGDGLEKPDAGHGRRRSGPGRRPCGQCGLWRHRAEMHRRLAADRASRGT